MTPVKTSRSDPFHVDTPPKAHYYPSRQRELTVEERQTCMSPAKEEDVATHAESEWVDNKTLSSSAFDESWPSGTDKTSSIDSNGGKTSRGSRLDGENVRERTGEKPTLARFIDRFRHAPPSSPLVRQSQIDAGSDFWWLHSPSPVTSTPEKDEETRQLLRGNGQRGLTQQVREREEAAGLTERAEELLRMSEQMSSVSSFEKAQVSSNEAQSGTTSTSPPAQRYPMTRQIGRQPTLPQRQTPVHGVRAAATAEDDILYQWRLRRRMEKAHEESVHQPWDPLGRRREQMQYRGSVPVHRHTVDQAATGLVSCHLEQQEVSPAAPPPVHDCIDCLIHPVRTVASVNEVAASGDGLSAALPAVRQMEYAPVAPHTHLLCDIVSCNHLAAAARNRSAPLSPPFNVPLTAAPTTTCRHVLEKNQHPTVNSEKSQQFDPITETTSNQQHVPPTGDEHTDINTPSTSIEQTGTTAHSNGQYVGIPLTDDLTAVFAQDEVLQSLLLGERRCQERLRSLEQLLNDEVR